MALSSATSCRKHQREREEERARKVSQEAFVLDPGKYPGTQDCLWGLSLTSQTWKVQSSLDSLLPGESGSCINNLPHTAPGPGVGELVHGLFMCLD